MRTLNVFQGNRHESFRSDLLIYKRHEIENKTGGGEVRKSYWNEILSFTLYGVGNTLIDFLKKTQKLSLSRWDAAELTEFFAPTLESYEISPPIKKGDFVKIVISKKVNAIITKGEENPDPEFAEADAKKKLPPSYPLLFLNGKNEEEQKNRVYKMVKNGVTTPMFSNVEEHLILAGELFSDKETAKNILLHLKGEDAEPVPEALLERAKYLMSCYQQWKDYIFKEMIAAKLIREVKVDYHFDKNGKPEPLDVYEVVIDEKLIQKIVQKGIRSGHIEFTKNKSFKKRITKFDEFMPIHAKKMKERIERLAKPLHMTGVIRTETEMYFPLLKRKPITRQMDTIEACLKAMEQKGKVNIIGEPGVGKTFMMLSTNWIFNKLKKKTMKLLVYCPDTLVETVWQEEIAATLYDCETHEITSINDLIAFEKSGYFDDGQDRVFILSQQVAKSSYSVKPAAKWSKAHQHFACPVCGETVKKLVANPEAADDPEAPKKIEVKVPFDFFEGERDNNRKCKHCSAVLWGPINKNAKRKSEMLYNAAMKGFYPRDPRPIRAKIDELEEQRSKSEAPSLRARLKREIADLRNLEAMSRLKNKEDKKISPHRVSAAEYIFKKMKRRFTNLIIDEFHEFQNDSDRSDACVHLISSIPVIQTGTGTAMNGYARSRFKTDFMLYPEKMKKAGYEIGDAEKYQNDYGVNEKRYRRVTVDGVPKKQSLPTVARPGISPIIFPLFMQDTTVFLSLTDLKDDLPELEHYQIEVPIDPVLDEAKKTLEEQIKEVAKYDKKLFRGSIQVGYSFLDSPSVQKELRDRDTKEVVIKTPTVPVHNDNKLQALFDLAKNEVQISKRRMMVYTYYTSDGINEYLRKSLAAEGYKLTLLNRQDEYSLSCDGSSVKVLKENREKFIRSEVAKGTEILVVNPELIKTGYNLTAFPTICYYQMGYQVYTNRQADRRSWRIGQTVDCKIIYLYYKESIQQDIASLMATKIVASQAIEGNMDAAGLEAICNDRTAEEELAKKFFEGIRDKVSFKNYPSDEEYESKAKFSA